MSEDQNTKVKRETMDLAARINRYAVRRGWSKARLCREYPALGSERTFRDMLAGRVASYDTAAQLASLTAVWAALDDLSGEGAEEEVYDDLTPVASIATACLGAMKSWGINRVVIVLGEPGAGKTTSMRYLAERYGERLLAVEASDVWADKPTALLGALAEELGEIAPPTPAVERLRLVQRKLSVTRRTVVVDEAHHLGPRCLNTIKTLVNTTPGEFVLLAIPSLWAKLNRTAYVEAKQLSTNRLHELVQLELEERDIKTYLRHRLPGLPEALARKAAKLVRPTALAAGNLSFMRDLADELQHEQESLSLQSVSDALALTLARRVESRRR